MIPYIPRNSIFLGPIPIPTEMFFSTLASLIFIYLLWKELEKEDVLNLKKNMSRYILFITCFFVFTLLGGRMWYSFENGFPLSAGEFINPLVEGLTSFGMIVSATIYVFLFVTLATKCYNLKKIIHQTKFAKLIDKIAMVAPAYIMIYRMGCFFYGDIIGTRTNLPWGLLWPDKIARHPAALYYILSGLMIYIVLRIFFRKEKTKTSLVGKRFDREIAFWFLLLYCFNRFWIEFFIVGKQFLWNMKLAQLVCIGIIIFLLLRFVPVYILLYLKKQRNKK